MPLKALSRSMVFLCLMLACWFWTCVRATRRGRGPHQDGGRNRVHRQVGNLHPARVGALVYESDTLRTGTDGQLAVMLRDETRLSMGPGSEITLAGFTFAPAEGQLSMVLRIARGALSYVSGRIARLMPEAVRLETPTSVIGVRGTHALIRVEAP